MAIVDCPNCRGEGYIKVNFDDNSKESKCQACNGTGEVLSPDDDQEN